MPKYEGSSHINTAGKVLEVGENYQYSEDGYIADVRLAADRSTENYMEFGVEILKVLNWSMYGEGIGPKVGEIVTLGATRGPGAYSGMWRLWKPDEYVVMSD